MKQSWCARREQRSHLPSVHSEKELEFMVGLGKAAGWFGPKKGVYLGWPHTLYSSVSVCVPGGKILDNAELVWTDGTPTDFTLWSSEERRESCLAVFADLVFQPTRQAQNQEISHR